MFRKTVISTVAAAALAATAFGSNAVAGGYGHGYGHGYGYGHHKKIIIKTPRGGYGKKHVAWCYDRYRSYRDWDNSFRPYHGPRQKCWSPYYRG